MEALHISALLEALSDLLPVLILELLHSSGQLLVLLRCPVSLIGSILVLSRTSLVNIRVF